MLDNKAIHCPLAVPGPDLSPSKSFFDRFLALLFLFFTFGFRFSPKNLH